ncbi:MAG: WD40/YVTN/BNR-like repeat-containing protein [Steroidobacterales bacterium]
MRLKVSAATGGLGILLLATSGLWGVAHAAGHAADSGNAPQDPMNPSLYQALEWRNIGPSTGGRTTAVAGVPKELTTFYIGSSGGGVWKTVDAGGSWHNISDGYFDVGGIGAIAVATSDPRTIYVGTGEASIRGQTTSPGDGIYKSTDGGKTWVHLEGLRDSRHIAAIVIDSRNPDVVYAAVQGNPWKPTQTRGVYRSQDGGKSWQRVLFVNTTTGAHDLSIDPRDPRILYAGMWDYLRQPWNIRSGGPGSGLWKSTDGGTSWQRLRNGLPSLMGNTGVSVSPADPDRIYAMIEAVDGGVFRSDDAGASWQRVNGDAGIRDRGWYYTRIYADPAKKDTVYVLANSVVKSTDGGGTFEGVRTPHGDNHDLWINPTDDRIMVEGNDGGGTVTVNGGASWSSEINQLTGQFYRVAVDDAFPYRIYGGQQDRSTVSIASRTLGLGIGPRDWHGVGGGESGQISLNARDPKLVYATDILGGLDEYDASDEQVRHIQPYEYFAAFLPPRELKYRSNWSAPVLVSMHDPKVVYYGAQVLFKTSDRGYSWSVISPDLTRHELDKEGSDGGPISVEGAGGETYGTLTYIAESPRSAGTVWVGSDDGLVHLTRDGGQDWTDVTPPGIRQGQIQSIEVSPRTPGKAYVAVTRYKLGDLTPMLYRTTNYGRTWREIVNGLQPKSFVRVVREDPAREGLLYAGTETGMYVSFDDGESWQPFQLNLPKVPVTDLKVDDGDLIASTQGRAFWILDDLAPLEQLDSKVAKAGMYLFKPRRAYRLDRHFEFGPPELGQNPPEGALIRYELAAQPAASDGPVVLEILDSQGRVIRKFTSKPAEREVNSLVKGVETLPPAPPVPDHAGMNSYVWNLRVAPYTSTSDTIRYVSQVPYRVGPGTYTVRLSYDGRSVSQTLEVVNDPRHATRSASQWAQQQQLLAQLGSAVDDIHRTTNDMRAIAQQAQTLIQRAAAGRDADRVRAAGEALIARIAQWEEQVPQAPLPKGVQDYVSFPSRLLSTPVLNLISIVDQDPPVTLAAQKEAKALLSRWSASRAQAQSIKQHGLSTFEEALRRAGMPSAVEGWRSGSPPPPRVGLTQSAGSAMAESDTDEE